MRINDMKPMSNYTIAILAIFACILWSTAFAGVKIGLQYSEPISFAGIRFIISGLLLIPFWITKKRSLKRVFKNWKMIFITSIFQTILLYSLLFWALTYISGTITAIITGSSPLITALTAHILTKNDKLNRYKLLSITIGIIGIAIITLTSAESNLSNNHYIFGIVLLLLSCISSSIGNIIISHRKSFINPIALNSSQMLLGGIILLIISLPLNGLPRIPTEVNFYIALLWLSFISAVAFSIWFILLKTQDVKVSDLNIWKFVIPIFGAVFSWILIPGESPEFMTILGMLIAGGSILMYNLTPTNKNTV